MSDYIKEAIDAFPEDILTSVNTCASRNLFDLNENDKLVSPDRAETFHSIVAKLLWVMKRGRPDIELPISFLCTRVKAPSVKDWEKLKRVLQFLYGTLKDNRIIGFNDLASLLTYVDASYAVHNNMRSHTGGTM